MIEITRLINKKRFISYFVNAILKSFFFCIRQILKLFTNSEGSIVIISLHKLGDTVFTIPAIKQIQKFYKEKIVLFCHTQVIPIYEIAFNNLEFREVKPEYFIFNNRLATKNARRLLNTLKPKIIFDLTGVMTSATLIFNSRAKTIVGMNREQFKTIYDFYTPIRTVPHLIDRYLDVVSLIVPDIDRKKAKTPAFNLSENGKVLIHPFGGWNAKEWNLNKFIKLAVRLKDEYQVCLIAQQNTVPDEVIYEIMKNNIDVFQTQSIAELISIIKGSSFFIGNDSGPLHIATLLGVPTFTIYGPTNPDFSHPVGEQHNYIKEVLRCTPPDNKQYCFTFAGQSGCPAFLCMDSLEFEKVFNKVHSAIKKYCKPTY